MYPLYPTYEKIAESPDRWRLDEAGWRRLRRAEWVVTEKIHGANFCLSTDGRTIRCASRREWLAEGDDFFGWQAVRDALAPAVARTFALVCAGAPATRRLYLYGELFGGGYPHPDVAPVTGVQPIQTGIWYAPDIRFCAFDLRIEEEEENAARRRYLDWATACPLLQNAGLLAAEPLFVGRYEAAMEMPIRFDSALPRRLGRPALPAGSNPAEGVVLRPYREIDLRDRDGGPVRPVIKRKIPEFAEDRRFHAAERWTAAAVSAPDASSADLPLDLLKWEVYNRATLNRLQAAISKVGRPDGRRSRDGQLFTLLVSEILDETREVAPDAWAALPEERHGALTAYVREEVRDLLRNRRRQ